MGEGNGDMARIGLFYGSTSGKTRKAAELIRQALGEDAVELHDVREATADSLRQYDSLILGVPTWHRGELQDDWEEFAHALEAMNLSSKTVALFGLGDQASYPDAFADALGTLYEHLKRRGANVVGRWPTEGYRFTESAAVVDGAFIGLVLDEENQPELTEQRVQKWAEQIRTPLA
jgi:flavodoxin I